MAITGIDTIEGKQIIAAGAVSAKSAEMAYNDENGNPITGYQVAGDYYSASNPSGFITGVDLTPYQTIEGMTAYQPVGDYMTTADSANFYTTANESGFITGVDLTPYQTIEGMTAYATVESLTAKQDAGDYLSATDSANFLLTSDSGNFYTTANESGFISEVPAGTMNESAFEYSGGMITAYNGSAFKAGDEFPQSATEAIQVVTGHSADWDGTTEVVSSNSGSWGGEALPLSSRDGIDLEIDGDLLYIGASAITASIDEKLDSTAFSTVSGDFLTAHQSLDGYLQNTDLEISDNKITGISGVPLAAGGGGDVPEGVMAESGLEYNAADEISGYNGSAFATQKEVSHDNTLSGNGTSVSPLGVNKTWVDVTTAFDVRNISNDSTMSFLYSTTLGLVNWTFKFNAVTGNYGDTACRVCTIPSEYRPYSKFELANAEGSNFCDYYPDNGNVIPRNNQGYFSNSMTWPISSLVQ